jgi:uncharacterized protein YjbJ (UPF0337 family)
MGTTLPPLDAHKGQRENVLRQSRERYGRERGTVEGKIARWLA